MALSLDGFASRTVETEIEAGRTRLVEITLDATGPNPARGRPSVAPAEPR